MPVPEDDPGLGLDQPATIHLRTAPPALRLALAAFRDALRRDPATVPAIATVAAAAGVSPRTLQRQCRQILGLSPGAILRGMRLAGARRMLVRGDAPSVLEAALRHGFDHPGRFAMAYARAFGESPSRTLGMARRQGSSPPPDLPPAVLIEVRALLPRAADDAARARRATDELGAAICRAPGLALRADPPLPGPPPHRHYRLEGALERDAAVLALVRLPQGIVLWKAREPVRRHIGPGWAGRVVAALRAAIDREIVTAARRIPRRLADAETLVARARPAALMLEAETVAMALDLLDEALHRDPFHARAHALAGWCRAQGANQCFTRDADAERDRAFRHGQRALALAPDDPEVLTLAAGVMSLTRRLDDAERLVRRSLALDANQPEAWRRLGFIGNFRGDGAQGARAFRRVLRAWPAGNDGNMARIGLGVAHFISGDYVASARALARALEEQPSRGWPNRFLTAAATHAGAHAAAGRSLDALRRTFPDLTVDWCAQSDALHHEALRRVLEGLSRAGLPR